MLLIDIGNSRIKWGTLESGILSARGAITHGATGLDQAISRVLDGQPRPDAAWIANVAGPGIGDAFAAACRSRWGLQARFAKAAPAALGVRSGYRDPERLGVDRWLAMIAARDRPGGSLCVVNCGTAVTIDLVDAAGNHLGGYILPGMELMAHSLSTATEAIRVTMDGASADRPGQSTQECVANGAGAAVAALIDRVMDRFVPGTAGSTHCVMSGGAAPAVIPLVRHGVVHDPDLVLRGLAMVAGAG